MAVGLWLVLHPDPLLPVTEGRRDQGRKCLKLSHTADMPHPEGLGGKGRASLQGLCIGACRSRALCHLESQA